MGLGRRPGAYCEYLRAVPGMLIPLPHGTDLKLAALAEPLSNAYRAAVRSDITPSDRALVLGAGPLGLCVIVCLRKMGVETVVVSEPNPARAAAAARVGASVVVNPSEQNLRDVIDGLPHGAPNVVFEIVGKREVVDEAFALTPANGRTVLLGICMESVQIVPVRWVVEEVSVIGSIGCDDEQFRESADWIVRGEVDVEPLISHVISIEEVPAMFERLLHPTDELKVLVGF
jgi:(R,R)-butanediol dehydrogenase/meso-butanediol dehydrogenase/diacetyl reductase